MATRFEINGAGASLAPYDLQWNRSEIGTDFNQRPIYEPTWTVIMNFDTASATFAQQWLEAASSGSVNVTILNRFETGWTDLSGVYMIPVGYPTMQGGYHSGFQISIKGIP